MTRMEPVAWKDPNGIGFCYVQRVHWVPLYSADQIREMVEAVRTPLGPRPGINEEDYKRYAWAGAVDALNALLAQLEEE